MFRDARQLVVKAYRPWRKWLTLAVLVIGVPVLAWALFDYGRHRAGYDSGEAGRRLAEAQATATELRELNETLRQRLVTMEQARRIDKQAYAEINADLVALQEEVLELKEEVAFYRGIVSPEQAAEGVRVQSLRLAASGTARAYSYKLILTQMDKAAKPVKGSAKIVVQGLKDQAPAEFSLGELAGQAGGSYKFQFKYFDKSEGDIILPEGFVPTRVVVEVLTDVPRRSRAERSYAWQEVAL